MVALAKPATQARHTNTLQYAVGHFKQTLDQAKKDADQAMQAYRKTIADYQVSSRQAGIARSRVSELQQKKDQTARELEELRSKVPAFSPDK